MAHLDAIIESSLELQSRLMNLEKSEVFWSNPASVNETVTFSIILPKKALCEERISTLSPAQFRWTWGVRGETEKPARMKMSTPMASSTRRSAIGERRR